MFFPFVLSHQPLEALVAVMDVRLEALELVSHCLLRTILNVLIPNRLRITVNREPKTVAIEANNLLSQF